MKRIVLLISCSFITTLAMAQWAVQAQYNLWIPTSKYTSDLKLGVIGVGLEAQYIFDDVVTATIGTGYALIPYKTVKVDRVEVPAEDVSDAAALQIIPITVGANVYFNKNKVRPYLDMDFGVALVQAVGEGMPNTDMNVNTFISPGFGIEYELSDELKFQGVVKQQVLIYNFDNRVNFLQAFTAVGINLGVSYKF